MAARAKRARDSALRAQEAAVAARTNPYVQRLIEDEQLRDDIREAYVAARCAFERMTNGKGPAKALMEDKKTQRALRHSVDSLRSAAEGLKGRRRKRRARRVLAIALVGAGLALVLSEGARKAVLDKVFGSEEEFEYTSTTSPAEAPTGV